jgi:dephospho-CoA kinase
MAWRPRAIRVFGLTGGIGAGKTVVGRVFRRAGIPVIDADEVARNLLAPGTALSVSVVETFGEGILGPDGRIDRAALGRRVFPDPAALATLNRLTHGAVLDVLGTRLGILAEMGVPIAVVEAALIVDVDLHRDLDGLVVVSAPDASRIARAASRDGASPADVRARAASQVPEAERLAAARWVIRNEAGLEELTDQAIHVAVELARERGRKEASP